MSDVTSILSQIRAHEMRSRSVLADAPPSGAIEPESSRMNQTLGATASPDCSGTLGTMSAAWTGREAMATAAPMAMANRRWLERAGREVRWLMALLRSWRRGAREIIPAR